MRKHYFSQRFVFTALSFSALLTGCASLNSDFDCKMKSGMPCKSVEEVNHVVDQSEHSKAKAPSSQTKILRIWLPPYEDSAHAFHEARYVNAMVDEKG